MNQKRRISPVMALMILASLGVTLPVAAKPEEKPKDPLPPEDEKKPVADDAIKLPA